MIHVHFYIHNVIVDHFVIKLYLLEVIFSLQNKVLSRNYEEKPFYQNTHYLL